MKINCRPPKTLRAWLEKNSEKVNEVDYGGGYSTNSEMAYDILLAPGWHAYGDRVHSIIEQTASETLRELRRIARDPECGINGKYCDDE